MEGGKMNDSPKQSILSVIEDEREISKTDSTKTEFDSCLPSVSEIVRLFEKKSNPPKVRQSSIISGIDSTAIKKDTVIHLREQFHFRVNRIDRFLETKKSVEEEREVMMVENGKLRRRVEMSTALAQFTDLGIDCDMEFRDLKTIMRLKNLKS
ncbi:hypothetical protein HK098_004329 [Nowakowskiella sp. JEL0407]|nr:hypothetical protein HK098_004329 [Nowakowskiella sp. JEL0407]